MRGVVKIRGKDEVTARLTELYDSLLWHLEQRRRGQQTGPEQDLHILSLLDQLEALLWVLEERSQQPLLH